MSSTCSYSSPEHYQIKTDNTLKCICQLCSCGRHRCPKQQPKGDYTTSYGSQYQNYKVVPVQRKERERYREMHYNPEVLKSRYQESYGPVQGEMSVLTASRMGNIGRGILKSEPFIGKTSYHDQYKGFTVVQGEGEEPAGSNSRLKITDSRQRESVKFQGESMYKSAFHEQPMPKVERYKHPEVKNPLPFQGSSSYKQDYPSFKVQVSSQPKGSPSSSGKKVKFQGTSSYQRHFGTFKVVPQPQPQAIKPCKLQQVHLPETNYLNNSHHVYYDTKRQQFV